MSLCSREKTLKRTSADLHVAIIYGDNIGFWKIVQKGIPLDTMWRGVTPISYALYNKRDKMLLGLVKAGANVNIKTEDDKMEPPLFAACRLNYYTALKILLLSPTLDINQRDFFNRTPLWAAVRHRSFDAAKLLLDSGANINFAKCSTECPLQLAFQYSNQNPRKKIAHLLIRRGCLLFPDKSKDSALQWAVKYEDRETFYLLILAGYTLIETRILKYEILPEPWKNDKEFSRWIKLILSEPLPLFHLAKLVIRRVLAMSRNNIHPSHVAQLKIPDSLKRTILLKD